MKIYFRYLSCLFVFLAFTSCKQEEIMIYEQNPGIGFGANAMAYSFIDYPGKNEITVRLSVDITGDSVNYDREFAVVVIRDSMTTVSDDMYEVLPGIVKAGEFKGFLPVKFKYNKQMDDSIFSIKIGIIESKEFKELSLGGRRVIVDITNKVIPPANWGWLSYDLGDFSSSWWRFILDKTGRTSLPYFPGQDPEIWWMTFNELDAYLTLIKIELTNYNNSNPDNPLTHDDGKKAGQPVIMP